MENGQSVTTDSEGNVVVRINGATARALRQLIRTATNKGASSEWWRKLAIECAPAAAQLPEAP